MTRQTPLTPHASTGRIPWQAWMQLRHTAIPLSACQAAPPGSLRNAARGAQPGGHLTPHQREQARTLLYLVCAWLDERLAKPVRVRKASRTERIISILDGIGYRIDHEQRTISAGMFDHNGVYQMRLHDPELGQPLAESRSILLLLETLDLLDLRQKDLFFDAKPLATCGAWLTATLQFLLQRHPAIRRLQRTTLAELLKAPREIHSIALACRAAPYGWELFTRDLCMVWRHEARFRQVARENPQLLPLVLGMYHMMRIMPFGMPKDYDPIRSLHDTLLPYNASPAVWRYVVHHGAHLFRAAWKISGGHNPFHVARRYLAALAAAGLPPPPPPSVAYALLRAYNPRNDRNISIHEDFHRPIHPVVLRAGLIEADRRRRAGELEGYIDEFLGVCRWSEQPGLEIDRNQARAGWPWLVEQWQEYERQQAYLDGIDPRRWRTRLGPFTAGDLVVIPIRSTDELITESIAMRNCLDAYCDQCADGAIEIYSIRHRVTGKRHGNIGIRFNEEDKPRIFDNRRYANQPPDRPLADIAVELLLRHRLLPLLPAHPPQPTTPPHDA